MTKISPTHDRWDGSQLETPVLSDTFGAGSGLSEAFAFFFASQSLALVLIALMPFPLPFSTFWPVLVITCILSAAWALRRIAGKVPSPDAVMVRHGLPPRRATVWSYGLLVASTPSTLLASLAVENYIWSSSPVPVASSAAVLHLVALFFLILTGIAIWKAHGHYLDATRLRTVYACPSRYDPLRYAESGQVLLGHVFRHITQIPVSSPDSSLNALPGEVERSTIEAWVGENGPFTLDLEKELNLHAAILGPSGSGKTEAVKAIVLRYWLAKRIASLIIDLRGEYAGFISHIGGLVWTVPTNFRINPLRLAGFAPVERAAELEESLTYVIGLSPLQAAEVHKVAIEAYRQKGILQEDSST